MRHLKSLAAAGLLCLAPAAVIAQTVESPWLLHFGAHVVDPKSDTGRIAGLKSSTTNNTRPTISVEYRFTPNWSVEALAAVPFQHRVRLAGQSAVSVKQLPPVLGVNYRFLPDRPVTPFLGVGVNYTRFFDAKGRNALENANVDVGSSWGVAWHGGVDVALDDRWTFTVDARYINIDAKVKVNGTRVGTAHVAPWVYGLSFGYRL